MQRQHHDNKLEQRVRRLDSLMQRVARRLTSVSEWIKYVNLVSIVRMSIFKVRVGLRVFNGWEDLMR